MTLVISFNKGVVFLSLSFVKKQGDILEYTEVMLSFFLKPTTGKHLFVRIQDLLYTIQNHKIVKKQHKDCCFHVLNVFITRTTTFSCFPELFPETRGTPTT